MWYHIQTNTVLIKIYAKPNARKNAIVGLSQQGLQVMLNAQPESGKANKALIEFLAEVFALPKSQIQLKKGAASRYKQVELPLTDAVKSKLQTLVT